MVGGIGIEPMTPSVSGKCSPTELTALGPRRVYQRLSRGSNGFLPNAPSPSGFALNPWSMRERSGQRASSAPISLEERQHMAARKKTKTAVGATKKAAGTVRKVSHVAADVSGVVEAGAAAVGSRKKASARKH